MEARLSAWAADGSAPAWLVWTCFTLLLGLAYVPLALTPLPPLFDYPNHLARFHLLDEGGNRFYQVHWSATPNLGADLVVPLLARLMPVGDGARIFLGLVLALSASGPLVLNRVLSGDWHWSPLAAFLFLYHRSFLWGFINYCVGIGLCLWGAAAWVALERRPARRAIVAALFGLATYFSHIEAFAVYGIVLAGLEGPGIWRDWATGRRSRPVIRVLSLISAGAIPLALFFALWNVPAGIHASLGGLLRKPDLLFGVFDNYNRPFDVACFLLVLAGGGWLWRTGAGRVPGLVPRLLPALLLLTVVYIVVPSQAFSGAGADHRLPPMLFLLLSAGLAPCLATRRAGLIVAGVALALFTVRMAVITGVWLQANRVYQADLAVLDQLPAGTTLAVAYPPPAVNMGGIPTTHLPALAVLRREAFVPTLFADPRQQPIIIRPGWAQAAERADPTRVWADLTAGRVRPDRLAGFDYVLVLDRKPLSALDGPCLARVAGTGSFDLYRIRALDCSSRQSGVAP